MPCVSCTEAHGFVGALVAERVSQPSNQSISKACGTARLRSVPYNCTCHAFDLGGRDVLLGNSFWGRAVSVVLAVTLCLNGTSFGLSSGGPGPTGASAAVPAYKWTKPLAAPDRVAVAIEVSKASFPTTAPVVIIATTRSLPDTLAGAPLGWSASSSRTTQGCLRARPLLARPRFDLCS